MDLAAPLSSICPHTHGRVLSVLVDPERPLSGNEVARRAGLSPGGAMASLDDLVAAVDDDALLEEPEWCGQVDGLAEAVWHWTGNRVAVTHCRAGDLAREVAGQGSEEGQEVAWLLTAGRRIAPVTTASEPDRWVGPLPRNVLRRGASPAQ